MMCQRIGLPPISIMGLGLRCDSSLIRVPKPPAKIIAFILPHKITNDLLVCLASELQENDYVASLLLNQSVLFPQ